MEGGDDQIRNVPALLSGRRVYIIKYYTRPSALFVCVGGGGGALEARSVSGATAAANAEAVVDPRLNHKTPDGLSVQDEN